MIDPDGDKVIDREDESTLFKELLALRDDRRLFLISDHRNRGKSALLRKLKYYCDWEHKPPLPASLVRLDDLTDPQPYQLVEAIWKDLRAKIGFTQFDALRQAILTENAAPFADRGSVNLQGAQISGGQQAGVMHNIDARGAGKVDIQLSSPKWDPGFAAYAREQATHAFFEELMKICASQQAVILIDSVDDQANATLRNWVLDEFTRTQVLDRLGPRASLIVVLAGRKERSPFDRLKNNYPLLVQSLEALGAWSNEHVRAFLDLNRPDDAVDWVFEDAEIEFLRNKINAGTTLQKALSVGKLLKSQG